MDDIRIVVSASPSLQKFLNQFQEHPQVYPHHVVRDGLLYHNNCLVIPKENHSIVNVILQEFHSSRIGGHAGFLRTFLRITGHYFWDGMRADIREFVHTCQVCQRAKQVQTSLAGLLSPLPIPTRVWEDIAMDFITGLPSSQGYTVILVVVDRLSKYAHFAPLRSSFTAVQVAEIFLTTVVKLHGVPQSIVTDHDKVFTSAFWQHLFKLQGTSLKMSSSYHPQTDGQS